MMRMTVMRRCVAVAAVSFPLSSVASAADLFSDPGESLSNFTVLQEPSTNTSAASLDYSTLGIPEAPGKLAGSAATTGFLLTANKAGSNAASITGLNLVLGATPQTFSLTHTLEYYVWMNVPTGATGTTENFLGGVNRSTTANAIFGNFRTSRGNGGWFLMSGDNGSATDYRHLNGGTAGPAFNDTDAAFSPKLNAAFTKNLGGTNAEAANEWVKVDVVFDAAAQTSNVYMNNVLFSSFAVTNTSGFAWVGYEDTSAGVGTTGLGGVFDNIRVIDGNAGLPEPTALAAGVPLAGLLLRRRRRN